MTREEACLKLHEIVKDELGVHEIPGASANRCIVEYASYTTLKATSDEVAWCSSLANFAVHEAGFDPTYSAAARSWLNWGVAIEKPIVGCIVIVDRKDVHNPNAAHVCFCDHADISNGMIRVIGGNQSDKVSVARFPTAKVLGYRSPI